MATWLEQQALQSTRFKQLLALAEPLGFTLIDPPYFIDYDRFRSDQPMLNHQRFIKLSNPEGRLLVLRPDLTTSVMDQLNWTEADGPLKVCYYASTFFQTRERLEAKKEFGFEYFNAPLVTGETLMKDAMEKFQETFMLPLVLEVSHANILDTLLKLTQFNALDAKRFTEDFKAKSWDLLMPWLSAQALPKNILELIALVAQPTADLTALEASLQTLGFADEFKVILRDLSPFSRLKNIDVVFDLSVASARNYYAGVMFQAFAKTHPHALIRGGRYQVEGLGGQAIGMALTLDDLLEVTV
jgi:ATP phosphoribosyltransferase regulatory subunit